MSRVISQLRVEIFLNSTKVSETEIKNERLESTLYHLVNNNLFVFISKKDYENLDEKTTKEIDNISLENIQSNENKITLEDILKKKVVFVKYNNKNEIKEIIKMRDRVQGESYFAFLSVIK